MKPVHAGAALLAASLVAAPVAAFDIEDIRERGKLIAATSGSLPPLTFVDKNNELDGYDIQVARFVEKEIGIPIELNRLDWKGILPGLQTGRFDAVFSNVNITTERREIFEYSIPYSRAAVVIVVKADDDSITGYKTLAGKVVGGISGGNDGEIPARKISEEFGAFKDFKGYAGYTEMYADMGIGRVDAVVSPDLAAANFIKERPGIAKIVGEPYQVRFVGIPMRKGAVKLKAAVDAAIRKAREQGLIDEWARTYIGLDNYSSELIDHLP